MKGILLMILSLHLSGAVLFQATDTNSPTLRMFTKVIDQKYCETDYPDLALLHLSLQLTYTNQGPRPLIIYKGSNLIYYVLASADEDHIRNKQYELNMHVGWVTSEVTIEEASKPGKLFVILGPGASYRTEGNVSISIELEPNSTFLKPGQHVLQVVTETWPSTEEQFKQLQTKWSNDGVLWGRNVRSEPMPFTVEKRPQLVACK